MRSDDPQWKLSYDPGPDPLSYKAMLSEFKQGEKRAEEELETDPNLNGWVAAMNLEATVAEAAEEVQDLMRRVATAAKSSNGVRVRPERFVANLSSSLSKLVYNLGRCHGYKDNASR